MLARAGQLDSKQVVSTLQLAIQTRDATIATLKAEVDRLLTTLAELDKSSQMEKALTEKTVLENLESFHKANPQHLSPPTVLAINSTASEPTHSESMPVLKTAQQLKESSSMRNMLHHVKDAPSLAQPHRNSPSLARSDRG